MSDEQIRGMAPKLLRYDFFLSDQAPTLVRMEIQADDGKHSFLATREILEHLAQSCSQTAAKMAKAGDLS